MDTRVPGARLQAHCCLLTTNNEAAPSIIKLESDNAAHSMWWLEKARWWLQKVGW